MKLIAQGVEIDITPKEADENLKRLLIDAKTRGIVFEPVHYAKPYPSEYYAKHGTLYRDSELLREHAEYYAKHGTHE